MNCCAPFPLSVQVCLCAFVFSPKGASLFSSLLFAFISLLNRLAQSLHYTCFRTEVKNCVAGIAGDRERGQRESLREKMKNKERGRHRETEE